MSFVKVCTSKYDNTDALEKDFHYCAQKCEYWNGYGVRTDSIAHAIFDMIQIKKLVEKEDGKQLYHMVISIWRLAMGNPQQIEKNTDLLVRSKGSKKKVLIAVDVLLVIAIIAAGAIFALHNKDNPASETNEEANNLFFQGLVTVCSDGKWGYVDETGEIVIEPQFGSAGQFARNGLAVASIEVDSGYKYGYIDKTGAYAISPQFDDAYDFADNGLASVMSGDLYGYIDAKGEYVIEPQFVSAGDFDREGLALVQMNTGRWGYINEKGDFIFTPGDYEI